MASQRPAAFGRLCVETYQKAVKNPDGSQPPSGGCVLKQTIQTYKSASPHPAAFGRLCVETFVPITRYRRGFQPPSGGCVLKPFLCGIRRICQHQPPSGGCVLKLYPATPRGCRNNQPPSGGCVLKHPQTNRADRNAPPAAFGRLCVETVILCSFI